MEKMVQHIHRIFRTIIVGK